MRKGAFLAVFLSCAGFAQAQDLGFGKSIPAGAPPSSSLPSGKTPTESSLDWKPSEKKPDRLLVEEKKDLFTKEKYVNTAEAYTNSMNAKPVEGSMKVNTKARDQYLGDLRLKAKKITFAYRDGQIIDGDRIRILFNDNVVQNNVLLGPDYRHIALDLNVGFNTLEILALSEGESAPSTGQVIVLNENGETIWSGHLDLLQGFKAKLIIVRD